MCEYLFELQLSYLCVTGAVLNSLSMAASFVPVYFQHVSRRTGSSVKQDQGKHFLLSFFKRIFKITKLKSVCGYPGRKCS